MKTLIIEDEKPAAQQLMRLLERSPNFEGTVDGPLQSVAESIEHLQNNHDYDLIFMDIHLVDGPSFEIFESVSNEIPVVFCTAYDQYALEAFKLNSVDYLLKPIEPEELDRALIKYKQWYRSEEKNGLSADAILAMLKKPADKENYKQRFLVKLGDRIISCETQEIDFFYSAEKATFLQNKEAKSYPLEYSLDQLTDMLDPQQFFRINRKYLVRLRGIEDMRSYSGSRIKLLLRSCEDDDVLVSRDRTTEFKLWLDR